MRWSLPIAVALLLGGCRNEDGTYIVFNTPPAVSITDPQEDAVFDQNETITFRAVVADDGGVENLELQWSSSIDQDLFNEDVPDDGGNLELVTASLSPGSHVITLRAFDEEASAGEGRVTIHVEGVPDHPSIVIEHPLQGEDGLEATPFAFEVLVSDHQDLETALVVDLDSDIVGPVCTMYADSTGAAWCEEVLPLGRHTLEFTVTDTDGFFATAMAIFDVVAEGDYDGDGDGFTPNQGDCNDNNATIHPGATELCDLLDNDCDAATPDGGPGSACWDDDSDNYCEQPPCRNASGTQSDCDDANGAVYPTATEVLDAWDNDCDGLKNEGTIKYDDDADGYCEAPPCENATNTQPDCNDGNWQVNPGVDEVCGNGIDDDCDNLQNSPNAVGCTTHYYDWDGDRYGRIYAPPSGTPATACYCTGGVAPYTGTALGDCHDGLISVNPGISSYATSPYTAVPGGQTFDYNCSGGAEFQYPNSATCTYSNFECNGGTGWVGPVAGCGQSRQFTDSCDFDWSTLLLGCALPCTIQCAFFSAGCASCIVGACPGALTCDASLEYRVQGCR